jgi:signal peptidase II
MIVVAAAWEVARIVRYSFWIIAAAVVVLDQWTKDLVWRAFPEGSSSVALVPDLVYLTHVHNPGVAFGQFAGAGPVLVAAAALAVACILAYRVRLIRTGAAPHPLQVLGLALPLGGAIGNMIDRIKIGKVVDFIDLRWFPVFNIADTAITVGALALVFYFLFVNPPAEESSADPVADAA